MKKILLLTLALLLAACSAGSKSEFDSNLSKWQDAGVSHYSFELGIGCFCPYADVLPATVEVKDGEIVSMVSVKGEAILPGEMFYADFAEYGTIDKVFAKTKSALDSADKISIIYDSQYGFPSAVDIDYIELAMDDELSLYVNNFQVLE